MKKNNQAIVMTGGDGFIGSHLTKHLAQHGYDIYAIVITDSPTKSRIEGLDNVYVIEGDLLSYKDIANKLPDSPKAFLHFAWAGVAPDQRDDYLLQMKNIELSKAAVNLATCINAQRFVFPGSTMEYIYYGKPINESAIPSPQNAYGVTKIACKYMCSLLCQKSGIPFIYSVISGIYSEDRADDNVIYYTISKLLAGERPVYTKLEQLWDYVHIDDVVAAFQSIIEKGKANAFYTIGYGDNWALSNYIYKIRDLIDPEADLGIGEKPYPNETLPCSCVDLSALKKDTGFQPKIPFNEGILRVIDEVKKKQGHKCRNEQKSS